MPERPRLHAELDLDPAVVLEVPGGRIDEVADHRVVRAVTGLEPPPGRHRILLDGHRIDRRSPARRVAAGLGIVDDAPVASEVTVLDHLAASSSISRAEELLTGCPRLAGRGPDPAGWLSGGERCLLAWLVCEATDPAAVVLDGAFRGLDPSTTAWAERTLGAWIERGVAVLRHDRLSDDRSVTRRPVGRCHG